MLGAQFDNIEMNGILVSPKLRIGKESELEGWDEVEEGGRQQHLPREAALVLLRSQQCQAAAEDVDAVEVGICHQVPSGCVWVLTEPD